MSVPHIRKISYSSWGSLIAVDSSYSSVFVQDIKRSIPARFRAWMAGERLWLIHLDREEGIIRLLIKHFGTYQWSEDIAPNHPSPGPKTKVWPGARRFGDPKVSYDPRYRNQDDHYDYGQRLRDPSTVLGVRLDCEPEVARAAYKALCKKHHPDQGGRNEIMAEINNAWDTLKKLRGIE